MERNVLPSARRIKDLKAAHVTSDMPELATVDVIARPLSAPELLAGPDIVEME
jgi:hypothetical protein